MKRSKLPTKRPEYVTREMLADLHDEIEHLLDQSTRTIARAERELERRYHLLEKLEARMEQIEKAVTETLGLLGTAPPPPRESRAWHKAVTWSYFHSWVARINDRLEALERAVSQGRDPS